MVKPTLLLSAAALLALASTPGHATEFIPMPGGAPPQRDCRSAPTPPLGPPPFGPLRLAAQLAALETYVGITTRQLDAWRGYTDALQSVLARPPEVPGPASPLSRRIPGEEMADALARKGEQGARLSSAIAALREGLSPEQLDRLAQAGADPAFLARPPGPPPSHRFPPAAPRPEGPEADLDPAP